MVSCRQRASVGSYQNVSARRHRLGNAVDEERLGTSNVHAMERSSRLAPKTEVSDAMQDSPRVCKLDQHSLNTARFNVGRELWLPSVTGRAQRVFDCTSSSFDDLANGFQRRNGVGWDDMRAPTACMTGNVRILTNDCNTQTG